VAIRKEIVWTIHIIGLIVAIGVLSGWGNLAWIMGLAWTYICVVVIFSICVVQASIFIEYKEDKEMLAEICESFPVQSTVLTEDQFETLEYEVRYLKKYLHFAAGSSWSKNSIDKIHLEHLLHRLRHNELREDDIDTLNSMMYMGTSPGDVEMKSAWWKVRRLSKVESLFYGSMFQITSAEAESMLDAVKRIIVTPGTTSGGDRAIAIILPTSQCTFAVCMGEGGPQIMLRTKKGRLIGCITAKDNINTTILKPAYQLAELLHKLSK